MNTETFIEILQWGAVILLAIGAIVAVYYVVKNLKTLFSGLVNAAEHALYEANHAYQSCAKNPGLTLCVFLWLGTAILGITGVVFLTKGINKALEKLRGKKMTQEEYDNAVNQTERAWEKFKEENPEKANEMTEEDILQAQREALYRKTKKSIEKVSQESDLPAESKEAALKEMNEEMAEQEQWAREENPDAGEHVDDAADHMEENMDNEPDFFDA